MTLPARPALAGGRHPTLTIALHWLSAFAVLLAFAVGWSREAFDEDASRAVLMAVHQTAGLLVFALLLARLAARLALGTRVADPSLARWVRLAATGGHLALYAALAAMPLLGWALASAHGHPPRLLGVLPLPSIANVDPDLAETLEGWHSGLAWAMAAFIASHVGAALWHHVFRRDGVLLGMLPEPVQRDPRGRRGPVPDGVAASEFGRSDFA